MPQPPASEARCSASRQPKDYVTAVRYGRNGLGTTKGCTERRRLLYRVSRRRYRQLRLFLFLPSLALTVKFLVPAVLPDVRHSLVLVCFPSAPASILAQNR